MATVESQAPATVRKKKDIAQRVKDKWGVLQAKDLKKSQIMSWLASFKFGAGSRNKHLRLVRAMFKLALDDGILARSPVEGVKEEKAEKPIRQTPSLTEFQAIVDSIRSQPFADTREESADFVEFLGLAGLGLAEATALTWGDVNFDRGQIITFRHKTRRGFAVPIFPQLRPLLEKRFALVLAVNDGKPPLPSAKVFLIANAKKAIEAACDRLKLPSYTSRSFRRTFITTAIERGVDVKVIAQWQGHRDGGKLILDTYSHVRPVHSEQMARLMTTDKPANVIPMEGAA
jgi:integrase